MPSRSPQPTDFVSKAFLRAYFQAFSILLT